MKTKEELNALRNELETLSFARFTQPLSLSMRSVPLAASLAGSCYFRIDSSSSATVSFQRE